MRQWKLTPEEEAEVMKRYDQSTPEIKRGIALEFAKRAIEGAVLVRKFQAALDAERAKVAGLAAACEAALENLSEVPGRERQWACVEIEAALRAAKEGTGPVQPDVRQWAADELIRITAESVDLPSPTDANWLRGKMLQVSLALEDGVIPVAEANVQPKQSGLGGEGTVPT